jgi:hypothetical protein
MLLLNIRRSIQSIFLLAVLSGVAMSGGSALPQGSKPIASKRTNGMTVMLTSESGGLNEGKNNICVSFQTIEGGQPVDASDVGIELTLRIGRNRGSPITAPLFEDAAGRYCGSLDLGRQYYSPATYDVVVRYVDASAKKRKVSFALTLR